MSEGEKWGLTKRRVQHGYTKVREIVQAGMDEKILSPAFLIYLCNI